MKGVQMMRKKLISAFLSLLFFAHPSAESSKTVTPLSQLDSCAITETDKTEPIATTTASPKSIFPPLFGVSDVPPLNFGEEEWNVFASRLSKQNPISRSKLFDPSDKGTWFNPFRMILPSVEDTQRVKLGMTIGEVVSILGKPQIQVGSGAIIFAFYLNNGQVFLTEWDSNIASDRIYRLWHMELLDENPFRIYL